ncbi:H17B6 dehydrogenase, partial [Dromaius novaehollandiae]|nr:H17B6 dehydrogenase [Dromaius novaehollandiae]
MWLYLAVLVGLYLLRRWHRERQRVPDLAEKYVLITGCDSGFGNLLARQLDARGLRVLAACLTEPGATQLRAAASSRLQTLLLDVTSSESIAAAAAWCVPGRGLWAPGSNCSFLPVPGAGRLCRQQGMAVLALRAQQTQLIWAVTLSLLPLVRRARGRVVNVASAAGRLTFFGGGYCPSKYGVEAFSDSLRRELRDFGVRVSIIEPGCFRTPIVDSEAARDSVARAWSLCSDEVRQAYGHHYFSTCDDFLRLLSTANSNLSLVTSAMEHALTAEHPRTRYSCGLDSQLYYIPLSYLPSSWTDRLLHSSALKPSGSA